MNEKELLNYIQVCCKHPKLYTTTGSFFEVVAFLEGYAAANIDEFYYHSIFTPFLKWVMKELGKAETTCDWNEFREAFATETEALKYLPFFYKKYIESSTPY